MKKLFLFAALLGAVAWSSSLVPTAATNGPGHKEQAVFQFNEPVVLLGVTLKGEYLFVHDDAAMARAGEACTFVYKGNADVSDKLVVSFHCTPAERSKVAQFTVRTAESIPGLVELREFQFGGSTEAHLVPAAK